MTFKFATIKHPLVFGSIFACLKTSSADLLVQMKIEDRKFDEVDWRRQIIFSSWGLVYLGGVQYFIYNFAFPRLFPAAKRFTEVPFRNKLQDREGIKAWAMQVSSDAGFFLIFYGKQTRIEDQSTALVRPQFISI
mmetsp:Transcript_63214/g.142568  ORF Transcript_63214/g.142568 Transcript_63214/m.142568 type:complete len:135 (+) Transcript_63214:267-671(+)